MKCSLLFIVQSSYKITKLQNNIKELRTPNGTVYGWKG